jgi:hypothetical protein
VFTLLFPTYLPDKKKKKAQKKGRLEKELTLLLTLVLKSTGVGRMRCGSPAIARGFTVQMLRRSWGMAAFRANARLFTRRLQHIRGTAVPMYADPLPRARRRFRRRRDLR